jgi:hypothetical protein
MEDSETGRPHRRANCRGSIALGTGCGRCPKCENERAILAGAGGLTPPKQGLEDWSQVSNPDWLLGLSKSFDLTPAQRADVVADIKGAIPEVPNGSNTEQHVPISPQSIDEAVRRRVGFVGHQEPMAIYELADGSIIHTKMVLMDVEVVEGVYQRDGTPMYNFVFNQVTYVSAPAHLKRRPGHDLG